jgi:hypothetical protein
VYDKLVSLFSSLLKIKGRKKKEITKPVFNQFFHSPKIIHPIKENPE